MSGSGSPSPEMTRAALPEAARAKVQKIAPRDAESAKTADELARSVKENPNQSPAQTVSEKLHAQDVKPQTATDAITENIGTEVGLDGEKVTPKKDSPEYKRTQRAKNADKATQDLLSGKKIEWSKQECEGLRKGLDQFINATGDATLASLAPEARAEIYAELVKDPAVLQALGEINGELNKDRIPDNVTELVIKAKEAADKYNAKAAERDKVAEELRLTEERLTDPKRKAQDERDFRRLQAEKLEAQKRSIQTRIDDALDRRGRINAGKYAGDPERENDALDGFYKQIDEIDAKIVQRDELANLPKKAEELKTQKSKLDTEVDELSGDKNSSDTALSEARGARRDAEEAWVADKENAVRDAVARVFDARMQEISKANDARLAQTEKDAKDEAERKIAARTRDRYYEHKDRGRFDPRSRIKLRGDNAKKDVVGSLFKADKGPRAMVQEMLEAEFGKDDPRVAEKMTDENFVQTAGNDMALNAMTVYLQTGGRIHSQEASFIQSQTWGKELIKNAMEQSSAVKQLDQDLREKGIKGGLMEAMKDKKKATGVIALLLAVAAGAVSAPLGAIGIAGVGAVAGGKALYDRG